MSDEYSLATRFLLGLESAAGYERRMDRLRKAQDAEEPIEAAPATDDPDYQAP